MESDVNENRQMSQIVACKSGLVCELLGHCQPPSNINVLSLLGC